MGGRADAMDKATGRALDAADLTAEGMLHGAVLRSPHPHADIVRIDTERARGMPGVAAVLTAADVPGINSYGRKTKDEPVLAESRVRKAGDPVALVVAASRAEAERRWRRSRSTTSPSPPSSIPRRRSPMGPRRSTRAATSSRRTGSTPGTSRTGSIGPTSSSTRRRIPRTRDAPEMTTILVADPGAPPEQQAKGVAECSNMVAAPAIANAVAHATGRRITRLPIRLERID